MDLFATLLQLWGAQGAFGGQLRLSPQGYWFGWEDSQGHTRWFRSIWRLSQHVWGD